MNWHTRGTLIPKYGIRRETVRFFNKVRSIRAAMLMRRRLEHAETNLMHLRGLHSVEPVENKCIFLNS